MDTRERILEAALDLFSAKGFAAVNVRDIAAAVGIRAPSLYNHFKGKEDIFETLVREHTERTSRFFRQADLVGEDLEFRVDDATLAMYRALTPEDLAAQAGPVFEAVFADEAGVKLRRLLTIEQYRSEALRRRFREISFEAAIAYQTRLFDAMVRAGLFRPADPSLLALEFYAPVFLLFYRFDGDADGAAQAKRLFTDHVRQFAATHAAPGPRDDASGRNTEGAAS